MARQKGILPLEGTIGNITFLKTSDGYLAREKTGPSGQRMRTSPAFARTRENWAEFGAAGKGAKLLRAAFNAVLPGIADKRMTSRLVQVLMRIVHTDSTHDRGARTIAAGDMALLEGFEFNQGSQLGNTLSALYTATADRAAGAADIVLPAFTPQLAIAAPAGTTHFRLMAAAAEADFAAGSYTVSQSETDDLPYDHQSVALPPLSCSLTAGGALPVFLVLGIRFLQAVNGKMYPLQNGAFNALALVKADA